MSKTLVIGNTLIGGTLVTRYAGKALRLIVANPVRALRWSPIVKRIAQKGGWNLLQVLITIPIAWAVALGGPITSAGRHPVETKQIVPSANCAPTMLTSLCDL
jgi:hypothetical protein